MNVLFFGGRDYRDEALIAAALDALPGILPTARFGVVHGGARGADSLAGMLAAKRGLPVIVVNANWDYYGRQQAGPIRNEWMLEFCNPVYAVGFPGGRGTADMNAQCEARGIPVWKPAGHLDGNIK